MIAAQKETFFRCTFSSARSQRVAHVRAWDRRDALQLFRTELQTEGVDERGTIEVEALDGGDPQRSDYRP